MNLFLLLLFPLGFIICVRVKGVEKFPRFLLLAFIGLFSAAVFCAYKYFFSPIYYLPQDSFLLNFLYYFLNQVFLPLAVLTAVFLFFSRKDSISDRFENLFGLYAGFYAVYIPFRVLNSALPHPFFLLFAKPLIYFLMVWAIPNITGALFAPKIVLPVAKKCLLAFALIGALVLPPALEALWVIF